VGSDATDDVGGGAQSSELKLTFFFNPGSLIFIRIVEPGLSLANSIRFNSGSKKSRFGALAVHLPHSSEGPR
jgi:hypothetical protein